MFKKLIDRILLKLYRRAFYLEQQGTYNGYRSKYELDESFRFNGDKILMYGEGRIIAGSNSYVGEYSTWQSSKGLKIEIGNNCRISHNVRCYTSSKKADYDFSLVEVPSVEGDVIIEDHVWIGANVFINPGVRVGENSIVGANSVLVKDVEPFSIVGGVPAKLIRMKKLD